MRANKRFGASQWILSGPVGYVILQMTLPMIPGVLALLALDFADSYLVSQLGTHSLAALGLTVPLTNLLFAVVMGASIGLVAQLTKSIGDARGVSPSQVVSAGFCVFALSAVILSVIMFFAVDPLLKFIAEPSQEGVKHGAEWGVLIPVAADYLQIRLLGFVFWLIPMLSIGVLRAVGDTRCAALILCGWTLFTALLDYALLNGVLAPPMGLVGIAWGHFVADLSFSCLCVFVIHRRAGLLVWPRAWLTRAGALLALSIPAMLNNILLPIAMAVLTLTIAQNGTGAVAVFGVVGRIEPLLLLIPMALTTSFSVFAGQNWAAQNYHRVKQGALLCVHFTFIAQAVIAASLFLLAEPLSILAGESTVLCEQLLSYLKIVPLSYGALGTSILMTSIFSAVGRVNTALRINVRRIFFIFLPSVLVAYWLYGVVGIYWGMAIGNIIAGAFAYIYLLELDKSFIPLTTGKKALAFGRRMVPF